MIDPAASIFTSGDRSLVVGHRGGRGEGWPAENTIAAFSRALSEGARAIELDVRSCHGGGVVVFHDATLARMTDGMDRREIDRMTLGELRRVKLGQTREPMPTLVDVLEWAGDRIAVNVEVKRDVADRLALTREVARVIASARADVIVSSFDPWILVAMAAIAPSVPRAWLTESSQDRWSPLWFPIAERAKLTAIHFERGQATRRAMARAHAAGINVGVWTVNDPDEARELERLGADWIITDAPAQIGAAVARNRL